jgi:hypothetical protein
VFERPAAPEGEVMTRDEVVEQMFDELAVYLFHGYYCGQDDAAMKFRKQEQDARQIKAKLALFVERLTRPATSVNGSLPKKGTDQRVN